MSRNKRISLKTAAEWARQAMLSFHTCMMSGSDTSSYIVLQYRQGVTLAKAGAAASWRSDVLVISFPGRSGGCMEAVFKSWQCPVPELRALQLQLGLHLLGFYAFLLKHFLLSSAVISFHVLSTLLELAIRGYFTFRESVLAKTPIQPIYSFSC